MAPGFQRLVNKWVSITRNSNVDSPHCSNHGSKAKARSEDHSTQTADTSSTACSSYFAGSHAENQEKSVTQPDHSTNCPECADIHEKVKEYIEISQYFEELQCKQCRKVLADAIEAVDSLNVKTDPSHDAMSEGEEDDSWFAESQESSDEESSVEQSKTGAFLYQLADFVENHDDIPFDLIDLWVPVFNPDATHNSIPQLFHAGHIVASNAPNSSKKNEFGQSSMVFSFEPGDGIPGRVYTSGLPIWESDLSNSASFERRDDAKKYGISTCLGLPVDSTIGRIVAIFYTEHQLTQRDAELISFIQNSITSNWNPNPRFILELDSDINDATMDDSADNLPIAPFSNNPNDPPALRPASFNRQSSSSSSNINDNNRSLDFDISNLLAEQMPMDESPVSSGYVSLRLVLLRSARSTQEEEIVTILRRSYRGYVVIQRRPQDMALLLVQDYMYLQNSYTRNNAGANPAMRMRSVSYSDMSTTGGN